MTPMKPNKRRNVELHIEELVLDGFAPQDKQHIASAVQQELHNLLSQGQLPQRSCNIEHLDGGAIRIEPRATPQSTGHKIARKLYGGLQE